MENCYISIWLDKRRAKSDGTYPVKLRIFTSKPRKQKLYPTTINLTVNDFERVFNSKTRGDKFRNIRDELQAIENKAKNIAKGIFPFTFEEFEKKYIRKVSDSSLVLSHYQEKIEELQIQNQVSTISNYRSSLKSISEFCNIVKKREFEDLTFLEITPVWLENYEYYMTEKKGRSITTVSMWLRALRTVFNHAISSNDIDSKIYPFGRDKYQIPVGNKVKKALTKDQLEKLFHAEVKSEFQNKARDFWFFSYSCNGINIKDIALLKFKNIEDERVEIIRAKTKRTARNQRSIIFYLNDFTKSIIGKYGKKKSIPNNFVFNIISENDTAVDQRRKIQNFTRFISQHLKILCKNIDLPEDISFQWARHTFTTIALNSNVDPMFISKSLGHSDIRTTMNYFAGFEDKRIKDFSKSLMDFDSSSND